MFGAFLKLLLLFHFPSVETSEETNTDCIHRQRRSSFMESGEKLFEYLGRSLREYFGTWKKVKFFSLPQILFGITYVSLSDDSLSNWLFSVHSAIFRRRSARYDPKKDGCHHGRTLTASGVHPKLTCENNYSNRKAQRLHHDSTRTPRKGDKSNPSYVRRKLHDQIAFVSPWFDLHSS